MRLRKDHGTGGFPTRTDAIVYFNEMAVFILFLISDLKKKKKPKQVDSQQFRWPTDFHCPLIARQAAKTAIKLNASGKHSP